MINKLVDKIKKQNAPVVVGLDPMMKFIPEHLKKAAFAEYGETLEGAAEAIENNIRRKMVEKVTVNPKYYEKMSAILDKLIQDRQKGVLSYKELLDEYIKLAKNVDHPEENEDYPESVKHSKAMQALFDNVGGDEALAIELHKAVMDSKMSGFRGDSIKERRIKRALFAILNDDTEVERLYKIIEKQEEYE